MTIADDSPLTAVGAYVFAGGFTCGVSQHFRVLAHLEGNQFGTRTARTNFPALDIHVGKRDWPIDELHDDGVNVVFANPPCAPWSTAAGRSSGSWKTNPEVSCWRDTFELVEQLEPDAWACESVRGVYRQGWPMIAEMSEHAQRLGYAVYHVLTNGTASGLPQRRQRYLLVLSRYRLDWQPTHKEAANPVEAIRDRGTEKVYQLMGRQGAWRRLVPYMKPGDRAQRVFDETYPDYVTECRMNEQPVKGRPSFSVRRLPEEGLAPTVTGRCEIIHPYEDRYLSVEEAAGLCGYPPWFLFRGSVSDCYAQVGKAVMPPTAEYVARTLRHGIERGETVDPVRPGDPHEEVEVFSDRVDERQVTVPREVSRAG